MVECEMECGGVEWKERGDRRNNEAERSERGGGGGKKRREKDV